VLHSYFVQVLDVIGLRGDASRSLAVFVEKLTLARLNRAVAPVLQVISLPHCHANSNLL
jgi:hypothetical protein